MRGPRAGLLLVVAFALFGCSSSASTPGTSTGLSPGQQTPSLAASAAAAVQLTNTTYVATPAAKTGGALVLGAWEYPDTINPYYAGHEYDVEVASSMFDGLVKVTPDLRYMPDLASNVPTIDNGGVVRTASGMDVTWTLKPGMEWSDGLPISCDDIKATWSWNMDPANTGLAGGTAGWEDISGVDGGAGTTCVIHFSKVYEGYLGLVSALLPAHYIQTVPVKDAPTKLYPMADLASGVYSGPYIPTSASRSAGIVLKPNPSYAAIGGHAPNLAAVTWKYYPDSTAMIAGYVAGQYDLGQDLNEGDIPSLATVDPAQLAVRDSLTYELQAFNNNSFQAKFGTDALPIIEAVKLATDRPAIASGPLAGNVSVANDFVSPLAWFYKNIAASTTADPTSAATLLANAGWAKNADGYLTKAGTLLELNYCTTNRQVRVDILKFVASQLKAIGIKVDVNAKASTDVFAPWGSTDPTTQCNLAHGNFDVAEFSYVSPVDPLAGYNVYVSTRTPAGTSAHDGQNFSGISLPALDAAYASVRGTADQGVVRDAMYQVQDIYGSDRNTYELPLYFRRNVWLVSPRVHNFAGGPTAAGAEWNIGDWWAG